MSTQSKWSRRSFLQAGGVLLVGLVGGGVFRAEQRGVFQVGQGPAYEPWVSWQNDMQNGPLSLVRAAILAASPHNSQPWLFRVSATQIDIYADTRRQIGMVDPLLREMYTGLGCALENLLLAAGVEGYTATTAYMPDPNDRTHAARITLAQGTPAANPLYAMIPQRRTNRLAYAVDRPVPSDLIERLDALNTDPDVRLFWVTDGEQRAQIGNHIVAATEALNADEEQSLASFGWWRGNWDVLQAQADGITPDAGQPSTFAQLIKMLPDADRATSDAAFLDQTRTRHVATAMGYGFIAVRDQMDNTLRLRGGQLWQRIHLQATIDGLGMQPLNQMAERADREFQLGLEPTFTNVLAAIIDDPAFHTLMPFRFGYPAELPGAPGPRRPVEQVLLEATR